ncbi:MAG: hypothetical protein AAGA81_00075 [Acidobacteriota bacterium]
MAELVMPTARAFGWDLKPTSSTHFAMETRASGQFAVILNHSLLRGVTAEMIHWWFLHFPSLRVRLRDVPGYHEEFVPAYLLWHPTDHVSATLSGVLGPGGTSRAGAKIHIQEAMQYDTYGLKYPVDTTLEVLYCEDDGWSMGLVLPLFGKVMVLSIRFKDVVDRGKHLGVHYHYEIVAGLGSRDPISRFVNRKVTGHYTQEFFSAWHLHNAIEVGTFENFLPALYAQRSSPDTLTYAPEMNEAPSGVARQTGYDPALLERRREGYRNTKNAFAFQSAEAPASF